MMRILLVLVLSAVLAQDRTDLLRIDVVATDRQGNPVSDLKADDLEVWINNFRIPVQSIRHVAPSADVPQERLTVLLLDDLTMPPQLVLRGREAAQRFVARMRPGDRIGIVLLSGGLMEVTSDALRLRKRVDSFNQSAATIPVDRIGAHVLTTLAEVSRGMSEAQERRKTIVAIGSGWLLDTPIPPPQVGPEVRREWVDAVRAMALTDVTFYVIDPSGVGMTRATAGNIGFARETGGHAYLNTNDLAAAVDRILRDVDTYYEVLIADPPMGRKSAIRDLDVRSHRRDVVVRARRAIPGAASQGG